MAEYDVEKGFISKLIETGDLTTIKSKQIKPFMLSGLNRKVFSFIETYFIQNGLVPTARVVRSRFPQYSFARLLNEDTGKKYVGTEEPLGHWCDEVRRKKMHNTIVDATEKAAKNLSEMDSAAAYAELKKAITYVQAEIMETESVVLGSDPEARKALYLKRKETEGMMGLPYGIPKLDFLLKGLKPEELVMLLAVTGTGKTWTEVLIGSHALMQNYRVLQVVTEMSTEAMQDRYEAMLYRMKMSRPFDYNRFKSGKLTPKEEKSYFRFLDKLADMEPLIIDTCDSVSSIAASIEVNKPDLVLVDGVYLLEDDRGAKEDWAKVNNITKDLKLLAKHTHLPVFGNNQSDITKTDQKKGPQLNTMSFARAVSYHSDIVLGLSQDEQMRNDREAKLEALKNREGIRGSVVINWDFTQMNFDEIYGDFEQTSEEPPRSKKSAADDDDGMVDVEEE